VMSLTRSQDATKNAAVPMSKVPFKRVKFMSLIFMIPYKIRE